MKRLSALILAMMLAAAAAFGAEDEDAITDIEEKPHFESGAYIAGEEREGPGVKKGEGFDLSVPEILITGRIDTRILLKREISSMENIQDIKSILYEKGRVEMPYSYLKELELSPQASGRAAEKDYVGRLSLLGGTFSSFTADLILGKVMKDKSSIVFRGRHENYENERRNSRDTYDNKNYGVIFYEAFYDDIRASYNAGFTMNLFSNPYPGNPFGSSHSNGIFNASAGFSGTTAGVDYNAVVKYLYFTLQRDGGRAVYTENRAEAGAYAERDFMADDKTKIKAVVNAKGYGAFTESDFIDYSNPYDIESVFKVILYFEPVIFQGGFRVQGYRDDKEYYRMSPYLSAAWDILPWASLYADFKPRLMTPDYTEKLRVPFILPSKDALVPAQSANLRTGLNMSLFEVFADLYFSYYSVKNYAYLDTPAGENYFTFYNRDLDYTEAGITVETLKIRDFKVVAGYSYRNILGPGPVKITYFPAHSAEAAFIYEPDEWRFEAGLDTASDALGTLHETAGAYVALNLKASRRINDYFTIGGYVNNVLNNNYYLLYYYREKGLNLGLEAVIGF